MRAQLTVSLEAETASQDWDRILPELSGEINSRGLSHDSKSNHFNISHNNQGSNTIAMADIVL